METNPYKITIGRLNKKIERLKKQRDHFKEQYDHYFKVIETQPYLETRYKSYEESKRTREHTKDLEKRVKEQEMLIEFLSNGKIESWKIKMAYSELIKEEYAKLNAK